MKKLLRSSLLLLSLTIFYYQANAAVGDTTRIRVHDKVDITWFGNYDQMGFFPDGSTQYSKILMHYTMGCASTGCSDWDYTTKIEARIRTGQYDSNVASIDTISQAPLEIDTTWNVFEIMEPFELGRVITPYGGYMATGTQGFDNDWEHTYTFDVTDFITLLRDSIEIRAHYSGWSSGFSVTLDFDFIEGTPYRDVQSIQNLWRGSWGYSDGPTFNSTHLLPVDVDLSPNAINSKLRITPSGHGFDNNVNCAEFCIRDYTVAVNGAHVFTQTMWRDDCGLNPIYPQGGTWIYDRANWCPGGKAFAYEHELTSYVSPGSVVNLDMDIEEYTWTGNQAPSYIIDAQLVTYGSPNFTHDAAILDIIAPNNHEEHGRRNPICAKPSIQIQNTGSANLNGALITYGVVGGAPCYYWWIGDLGFLETEIVELPLFNWNGFDFLNPAFYATISKPNFYLEDEYEHNNTQMSYFDVPTSYNENMVILQVSSNSAGFENSFTLNDAEGNSLYFRGTYPSNTLVMDTFNLDQGCYTLHFRDSGKDGIAWWANNDGNGYVRLKKEGPGFFELFQNDYGTDIYHQFTIGYDLGFGPAGPDCPDVSGVEDHIYVESGLDIFPNPSDGLLNLSVSNMEDEEMDLAVINLTGQQVYSQKVRTGQGRILNIDLAHLPVGAYFVTIDNGETTMSEKFILVD